MHPFLTVVGPSGSGKSSLIFAGVLPALRKSHRFASGVWAVETMRPSEKHLTAFDTLISENRNGNEQKSTLLVVDQFEETFTGAVDEAISFKRHLYSLFKKLAFMLS